MAIDRDKIMRITDEIERWPGRLRWLGNNLKINLRFLEYQNTDGDTIFATQIAYHFRHGEYISICRQETFGKRCLFCEINKTNQTPPFAKLIYRYATNAIVVDILPSKVYSLIVPTTVFRQLSNYILQKNRLDATEPINGRIFTITCKGRDIQTRYWVKASAKKFPVGEEVLSQIQDPTLAIEDPGYEGQKNILREIKEWENRK